MSAAQRGLYPTSDFVPKAECLRELTGMGFDQETCIQALFYTGNNNTDAAVSWVFDNQGMSPQVGGMLRAGNPAGDWGGIVADGECKMVIVVNSALKMSPGKIAAQSAHAAIGAYRMIWESDGSAGNEQKSWLRKWEMDGETTIVLSGDDAPHLESLEQRAKDRGLVVLIVSDAGRTEVASGAKTALCIFGEKDKVDSITRSLQVFR
ncbi:hypothetical protein RvY_05191 [Ramazzottius varieornatus]|uniref:peptidyl-tRNA hydrolase n=1 Tax=Ramazzottius varieornatus TaxID=947166 RepID=A0A1D1V418_RAMVA|nr:hypothetical protein RvY_05191 [Ramazzottius varieornatus]